MTPPLNPETLRVIPADWSRHHQPVVATSMNATCRIIDPARETRGPWDEAKGDYGPSTPYVVQQDVSCRVQDLADRAAAQLIGGLKDQQSQYLVSIPHDAATVEVDYLIDQIVASNDSTWSGKTLHVDKIGRGSEVWDRYLYCTEHQH